MAFMLQLHGLQQIDVLFELLAWGRDFFFGPASEKDFLLWLWQT